MLRSISSALALSLLIAGAWCVPASAMESHVYVDNKSDAAVWITAYPKRMCAQVALSTHVPCAGGGPEVAWCVAPHTFDKRGFVNYIYEVRAEVTHPGCRHPVMLDQTRGFPFGNGQKSNTMTYYIHGSNGKYVFNNTP